jgi:hypothetical protein
MQRRAKARQTEPKLRILADRNKIRGRFIGVGNSVVVARLNVDGLPENDVAGSGRP